MGPGRALSSGGAALLICRRLGARQLLYQHLLWRPFECMGGHSIGPATVLCCAAVAKDFSLIISPPSNIWGWNLYCSRMSKRRAETKVILLRSMSTEAAELSVGTWIWISGSTVELSLLCGQFCFSSREAKGPFSCILWKTSKS
ncbi:unnamed protein product [Calypogeia fissa]